MTEKKFDVFSNQKKLKLEQKYVPIYQQYVSDPNPENLRKMIDALSPTIEKGIKTFGAGLPTLYGRAKLITSSALQSYDPKKGALDSHVMLHLQRLQRYLPKTSNVVDVSEATMMLQSQVMEAEKELEDELGRPPSDAELASHLKMSMKKLERLRTATGTVPSSAFDDNAQTQPIEQKTDDEKYKLWQEVVYMDLNPIQQYIAERRYGLHGKKQESVEEMARKLKISPNMVYQHLKTIEQKMAIPRDL